MKYRLYEATSEIKYKDRKYIRPGVTYDNLDCLGLVDTYSSENEALKALAKYKTDIRELKGNAGTYFVVNEYYIEEYEDDECDCPNGVIEFSTMEIEVVRKSDYETVGVFDNYSDAEDCLSELVSEYEEDGYISL